MLYLVGLGLKAKDLTLDGLETISKTDHVYYEEYTSVIDWIPELEAITGKKFKRLQRSDMEEGSKGLISLASVSDIVILISGDPLSATTHQALSSEAKSKGVQVGIVHAPSIMTAIGETGLWLYKFGRCVTIPKTGRFESVKTYVQNNRSIGLHTLILLDIGMTASDGTKRLLEEGIVGPDSQMIACSRLGRSDATIRPALARDLAERGIEGQPQCLVLPGKVHPMERV